MGVATESLFPGLRYLLHFAQLTTNPLSTCRCTWLGVQVVGESMLEGFIQRLLHSWLRYARVYPGRSEFA